MEEERVLESRLVGCDRQKVSSLAAGAIKWDLWLCLVGVWEFDINEIDLELSFRLDTN